LLRIYIDDGELTTDAFIYLDEENNDTYIYTDTESGNDPYLFTDDEATGILRTDFYVVIPIGLTFNINYLKSIVNKYKSAAKFIN